MDKKIFIDVDLVKEIMKDKNISLEIMASKMNVSMQILKKFLDGDDQKYMKVERMYEIANALDVSLVSIIHKDYH